jgi:glycerol-3-phosphate dehydrogenase (NAD(P)+)
MNIVVLGAGAWGTALAISAVRPAQADRRVTLWARDAQQSTELQQHRENHRYLSGVAVPAAVQITTGPLHSGSAVLDGADLVIVATPMAALRDMLALLAGQRLPVAWLCKGFEAPTTQATGLLGHEVRAQVAPDLRAGVLSGPSFALEVARGQPTALVAASEHAEVRDVLVAAFHSPTLRVYANDDIVGVEVGGAVKNVLAIATGIADGMALGMNARAALVTRGLAEMTRLGVALGARAETFTGLSGLGDLVLTTTGDLSRNRQVGLRLAQGLPLARVLAELGHVAEGVYSAATAQRRARDAGVEMPITDAVVRVLEGRATPAQALGQLMGRDARPEH